MSRTLRKLHMGRKYGLKWYGSHFEWRVIVELDRHYRRQMRPVRIAPVGWWDDHPEQGWHNELFYAHHWRYRNGSCRRQRIHGTALTKRLASRNARARAREVLHRMLTDMEVDELTEAMILSRSTRVGRNSEWEYRNHLGSFGYESDEITPPSPDCDQGFSR